MNSKQVEHKCASFLEVKDNKIVWTKNDSEITLLNFFKQSFACEGCGKETHLTSQSSNIDPEGGPHHPVCSECYKKIHAYHITIQKGEF